MATGTVKVVQVDPYHDVYGWLVHPLVKRLHSSLQALGDETDEVLVGFLTKLWGKDPSVLLLAAVDQVGEVKGHAAAMLQGPNQAMFIQPRLDVPTDNDAVSEMVEAIEAWAKDKGVAQLNLVVYRLDPKWAKKYGFEVARYVLAKDV